jgi:HSP20 family protein
MLRRNHESYAPVRRDNGWTAFPTFGDLFQGLFSPPTGTTAHAPLDLTETAESYKAVLDVPGFTMDQINVQLADNVLTVSGDQPEKVTETDEGKDEECRCHVVERTRSSFARSIRFPVPVDGGTVKASLKNGVLTITVPKSAAARAQKIKVTES